MILTSDFYKETEVVDLAQNLLGKVLVSEIGGKRTEGIIIETEAYREKDDDACHAFQHGRTPRTETMYGKSGRAYVYICYGIHHLFNVVSGPVGQGDAVLIRAVEPIYGMGTMSSRRNNQKKTNLCSGPGKLAEAMGITKSWDGSSLTGEDQIWIEDRNIDMDYPVVSSGRIGMPERLRCKDWPWRFYYKDNPYVS